MKLEDFDIWSDDFNESWLANYLINALLLGLSSMTIWRFLFAFYSYDYIAPIVMQVLAAFFILVCGIGAVTVWTFRKEKSDKIRLTSLFVIVLVSGFLAWF